MANVLLIFLFLGFVYSSAASQELPIIRSCSAKSGKFVGQRIRLFPPSGARIKKGHDVDYEDYSVAFGKSKQRVWMNGIYGPSATSGRPSSELLKLHVFSNRPYKTDDGTPVIDVRGKETNGNLWRFVGTFGEQIEYRNAPLAAAEYFDKMLDDACYMSWKRLTKK